MIVLLCGDGAGVSVNEGHSHLARLLDEPLHLLFAMALFVLFLANVHNIPTAIAFIHGVTSLAALGNLAPHLAAATLRRAVRYAWQAACGLYACYGAVPPTAERITSDYDRPDTLIERAIANGDEHVIKFTEACLNRNAVAPAPVYAAAAAHLLGVIRRG